MRNKLLRGLRVAIVGQDGAGKSTLIAGLVDRLTERKLMVKNYYMGSGAGYNSLLKDTLSIWPETKRNSTIWRAMRDILLLLFYTEISFKCLAKARQAKKKSELGYIVLFDRFPQCQFEGIYDGPKIDKKMRNCSFPARIFLPLFSQVERFFIMSAAKNTPDIVIKLSISVEISMERKADQNLLIIQRKNEITKALRFDGSLVFDIDASAEFSEVLCEAERYIFDNLKLSGQFVHSRGSMN